MMDKPTVQRIGDAYRFSWPGVCLELDRLYEHHDELSAEITVYSEIPPSPGLLHSARFNMASTAARDKLANVLAKRENSIDWGGVLESVCFQAREMHRRGDPAIDLRDVTPQVARWLHYPYLEFGGPTVLVAEGGSGKSVIALSIALQCALGGSAGPDRPRNPSTSALYLDWETTAEVHNERLMALSAGLGIDPIVLPGMYYRQMRSSITASAPTIRREIDELSVGVVILDSLGAAGDGTPEDSATILPVFQAIRSLRIPTLVVHHKRKTSGGFKSSARDQVFGSVYTYNMARLVWDMESRSNEDADETVVAMVNIKANNGRLQQRHGLALTFTNDGDRLTKVVVKRTDLRDDPEFAHKVGMRDRILGELQGGAKKAADIAAALDASRGTVAVRLTELQKAGLVLRLPDNQWGRAA